MGLGPLSLYSLAGARARTLAAFMQRALAMLCQKIEVSVKQIASSNGSALSKHEMLRYIDAALNFACIKHPDVAKHSDRLAKLVFPRRQLFQ
jgi:hypothetical protein